MESDRAVSGVVRGWGCTPTGDPPPGTVAANQSNENTKPSCLPAILHKGWRRTALYTILVVLMLLIFLNIALTFWIISALKLSIKGIGPIHIVKGGIQLDGQTWVMDKLVASTIASRLAQPITLHSHRNFTVHVSEPNQPEYARLLIKRDSIECRGSSFNVVDSRGGSVFHASRDEVRVGADAFVVDSVGGLKVKGAIQAQSVQAPHGSDLQLESLTRRLDLRAPQSIYLESRAGSIDITSHSNIKLDSIVGAIKIDAPNIIISNLKEATIAEKAQVNKNADISKVYQLCACASGKLFLAAPDAICSTDSDDSNLCR